MKGAPPFLALTSRRLDQWLWFARFVRSRSVGARLCAAGGVTVNRRAVKKPNHMIRIGDTIALPQGAFHRTVRVLSLGVRRGPAVEARLLYEEIAAPVRVTEFAPSWTPLLSEEEPLDEGSRA